MALPPRWDRAKQEMVVGRFFANMPNDFNLQVAAFIAMAEVEGISPPPAIEVLDALADLTDDIVRTIGEKAFALGFLK